MEIKDGRIKPTTKTEAIAYHRFLKTYEEDRGGDPIKAAAVEEATWMSEIDSYRLFCSMEKTIYTGTKIKPDQVMEEIEISSLRKMAQYHVEWLQEEISSFDEESARLTGNGSSNPVIHLASQAVRLSGQ